MTTRCQAPGCANPLLNGSLFCCHECEQHDRREQAYWTGRLDSLRRQTQGKQGSRSVLRRELAKRNQPLFQPGEFGFATDTEILPTEGLQR